MINNPAKILPSRQQITRLDNPKNHCSQILPSKAQKPKRNKKNTQISFKKFFCLKRYLIKCTAKHTHTHTHTKKKKRI